MRTIEFTNEKGNVRAKARTQIAAAYKNQIQEYIKDKDYVEEVGGTFAILEGYDVNNGNPIYTHINITINQQKPAAKPKYEAVKLFD